MKRKKLIIIALLAVWLLLTAYVSWKIPKLINANQPFIDLSGSVKSALSNAGDAYNEANVTPEPEATPTPEVTSEPQPTDTPTPTPEPTVAPKPVEIIVGNDFSGQMVTVDGEDCGNLAEIALIVSDKEHDGVNLIDNWAEVNTFKNVMNILNENGIEYSYEMEQ